MVYWLLVLIITLILDLITSLAHTNRNKDLWIVGSNPDYAHYLNEKADTSDLYPHGSKAYLIPIFDVLRKYGAVEINTTSLK